MTVLLLGKRSKPAPSRGRQRGGGPAQPRARRADEPAKQASNAPSGDGRELHRASARRIVPPPTQDRALYTCGCGLVFSQDVSTSVACPHCGCTQAW